MTMGRLFVGTTVIALTVLLGGAAARAAGPLDTPGYAKAFACSACHGFAGNSRSETVPILAGMPVWYFKKAIEDYASGKRPAAEMEPYAIGAWIRETTVAHEIAHQWWGNLVGWQSYRDQWLSEATANYAGLLFHASAAKNVTLADLSVGWRATLNRTARPTS